MWQEAKSYSANKVKKKICEVIVLSALFYAISLYNPQLAFLVLLL